MLCRIMLTQLLLVALSAQAQEVVSKPGTFCWPLHYAGVVAGTSQEKHVIRLLGPGAFRPEESDGVRYYVDPASMLTMKVSVFTDRIVGEIALEQGVNTTLTRAERSRAVSKHLSAAEGFGNWHALRLGSSREEVRANLGPPAKAVTADEWVYNSHCTCELPQYLTVQFHKGKVRRVIFSAPPG